MRAMLSPSTKTILEHNQEEYQFYAENYLDHLKLTLKSLSNDKQCDRVIVNQTIPSVLKPDIKTTQSLFQLLSTNSCQVKIPERLVRVQLKKKTGKQVVADIHLIQVKVQAESEEEAEDPINIVNMQISDSNNLGPEEEAMPKSRPELMVYSTQSLREFIESEINRKNQETEARLVNQNQKLRQAMEESLRQIEYSMNINKKMIVNFEMKIQRVEDQLQVLQKVVNSKDEQIRKLKNLEIEDEVQVSLDEVLMKGYIARKRKHNLIKDDNLNTENLEKAVIQKRENLNTENLEKAVKKKREFKMEKTNIAYADSQFIKEFVIEAGSIKYIGLNRVCTQLLLQKPIDFDSVCKASLKVIKSENTFIKFGVVDKSYIKERSSWSKKSTRCILYSGVSGDIFDSGEFVKSMGPGFREGQVVEMVVKLSLGWIQWHCDGFFAEIYSEQLKQPRVKWVPVVQMSNTGDIIALMV